MTKDTIITMKMGYMTTNILLNDISIFITSTRVSIPNEDTHGEDNTGVMLSFMPLQA